MARRTVFLGSNLSARVDMRGPLRPSWPDIDTRGVLAGDAGVDQLAAARAVALNYESDWDLVRVYFSGAIDAPELLGPGRVLHVPAGARVVRVEPVIPVPSTRLYDASNVRKGVLTPAALPAGVVITMATPDGDASQFQNDSAFALTVTRWNGAAYAAPPTPVWNAGGLLMPDGASNFVHLNEDNSGDSWSRPADLSFDGGQFSIADYVEAGLIPHANRGVARVSKFALDAHGNAGDPTASTTKKYAQYFQGGALASAGALSPFFYARLALDIWTDDADCLPRDAARLATSRFVELGAIAVVAGAASPDQALLTFPVINARRVEYLFKNTGAGNLFAVLVSPVGADSITGIAGVPDADPSPAAQFVTIASGSEGSLVLESPSHPLCKLIVGADGAGATIAAGSVLTVKRELDA